MTMAIFLCICVYSCSIWWQTWPAFNWWTSSTHISSSSSRWRHHNNWGQQLQRLHTSARPSSCCLMRTASNWCWSVAAATCSILHSLLQYVEIYSDKMSGISVALQSSVGKRRNSCCSLILIWMIKQLRWRYFWWHCTACCYKIAAKYQAVM